ncbi:MAG: indole-3-glycerol phosphate synthase TrpC [bacterium]
MSSILDTIIATKHEEVAARRLQVPLAELTRQSETVIPARGFCAALHQAAANSQPGVIAEIKKASPSKGVIRENFDPVAIAQSYTRHGATCLSVLTDEVYFQGSDQYLQAVRAVTELPIIRKDFVIDEYQVYEAKVLGADCILLIAAALNIMQLTVLNQTARGIGLDVLIEVHNLTELQAALSLRPTLIGINNRNLKTFETSLTNTIDLLPHIPDDVTVVTESGIRTLDDIDLMNRHGVYCFLVGETFMRADDPGQALRNLFF